MQNIESVVNALINLLEGNGSTDEVQKALETLSESVARLCTVDALSAQILSLLITFSNPIMLTFYTFASGNPLLIYLLDYLFGPAGMYRH